MCGNLRQILCPCCPDDKSVDAPATGSFLQNYEHEKESLLSEDNRDMTDEEEELHHEMSQHGYVAIAMQCFCCWKGPQLGGEDSSWAQRVGGEGAAARPTDGKEQNPCSDEGIDSYPYSFKRTNSAG